MKKKRIFAASAALAVLLAVMPTVSSTATEETGSYDMNIAINFDGERQEISPYIYGINTYGNETELDEVTTSALRQGGNRYTGYNWETNYSNAGEDWLNSSDTNLGDDSDGPAYAARSLSELCQENDISYKMTTLQMAGYVAADKAGTVLESEVAPSDRWYEVIFRKGDTLLDTPDLTDQVVYMDEYINYLVQNLGDATTSTGIQGYALDNEPVLWNDTHPFLHSEEVTNAELISKSIELASVVKEIDPNAEVYGPSFWGMLPCITIDDTDWNAVSDQYDWYIEYYLEQMAQAEEEAGTRLLDVLDVHYYAQDCSTEDAILQAARSLYDPDYQENSWLQPWYGDFFPFLTRLQEAIDTYYPGTKLSLTEYNLGNISDEKNTGASIVSGIAEAEALGAFADQGVYLATYWGTLSNCQYVESAINLYTNYDGEGSAFGDMLIESTSEDLSQAAVFAAIEGEDESTITTVLSNKNDTDTEKAMITLEGADIDYQSVTVYAITQDSSDIQVIDVQNDIVDNQIVVELPPLSVAQIVISDEESKAVITEEPDITTETVVYSYDELEISENGYPMIPLGDKEHLESIVIRTTVTSDAGSSWASGGGALCFNQVVEDGTDTAVWGYKSYSYSLGTYDNTIDFDDTYYIMGETSAKAVCASCNDTYAELQDWWVSSESDTAAGSDITVTIDSITLIYTYENGESNIILGDCNSDGLFALADVVLMQKWLLNISGTTLNDWTAADVFTDKQVNGFDLSVMRQMLLEQ